jgi:putative PIN family toxin of toxin-antitoxin system
VRVLVDTNVFVSYLLSHPSRTSAVRNIVDVVLSGAVTLLLPEALLAELLGVLTTRPYFTSRISNRIATEFIGALRARAELLPAIHPDEVPPVLRDPKDDYLLAYALLGRADYLVTGDRDLLVLERVEQLRIVTPGEFVEIATGGTA